MGIERSDKIKFQVETKRVLEILSKEIYDSPYALLRENIQNAYDAILMRSVEDRGWDINNGLVEVNISNRSIYIKDNGIGMTEEVLRNNFWKAGSSGKRTVTAMTAGVVGTFGIGAMANFGVCKHLKVETRHFSSNVTLISSVNRDNISLSEECIDLSSLDDCREPGTTIIASLEDNSPIDQNSSINYLLPYIKYLPVKVIINGTLYSQYNYLNEYIKDEKRLFDCGIKRITNNSISCNTQIMFDGNGTAYAKVNEISYGSSAIRGNLILIQGSSYLYGLRNYFGLSPIPIGQYYRLGGIVNLSILQPTAGREAISRESIEFVNQLIILIEKYISEELAQLEIADRNNQFISYVLNHNRTDLASNITIQIEPGSVKVPLGKVKEFCNIQQSYYYTGYDSSIIQTFSNENTKLIIISQNNPRRQLQHQYINSLGIRQVPDSAQILKNYNKTELNMSEVAFLLRLVSVLSDDYMLNNVKCNFADISHGVQILVEYSNNELIIYIHRNSSSVIPVLQCYDTAYEVFGGFIKDFIRVHLYPRISNYVPSSTKEGADALQKILKKNRELFKYEANDLGKLESIISEYISGKVDFAGVIQASKMIINSSRVVVEKNEMGSFEKEIPNIINSPVQNSTQQVDSQGNQEFGALPGILRSDIETSKKILKTEVKSEHLNNFQMFLSLSDRVFNSELEFFINPHTTKIIWGSHRIVYIFTHASSSFTVYYDIELKEPLIDDGVGGITCATTTIVTKNRIFIPIPHQLMPSFDLCEGSKEFYVRYDFISD